MTQVEGRSSYLDADAGSIDSAGRRLALAEDDHTSVPERVRVLADVGRFVDEFFQLAGSDGEPVRERVQRLLVRQSKAVQRLEHQLRQTGVELCDWSQLNDDDRQAVTAVFRERIVPVLGPLVVEAGEPLPPPANLSLNVAVIVGDPDDGRRFGSVELPPVVARFLRLRPRPGGTGVQVVPVEQVVLANLALLFPAGEIEACATFRVTRQAGVVAAPGVDDLLASVERQLRLERHGPAVRLEVDASMPGEILERLMADLDVDRNRVYAVEGLMGVTDLASLPLPDSGEQAARFRSPARPASDLFARLDAGEMLVHFPYEPYTDSVVALLDQASADPALLAIKQALYRPSPDPGAGAGGGARRPRGGGGGTGRPTRRAQQRRRRPGPGTGGRPCGLWPRRPAHALPADAGDPRRRRAGAVFPGDTPGPPALRGGGDGPAPSHPAP
jgi:polyphosphate kinase